MIQGQCKFSLHKSPILRQLTLTSSSHGKFSSLIAVTAVISEHTEPIFTQTLGAFQISPMPKLMWIDKEITEI